jgi:hypothetical protein
MPNGLRTFLSLLIVFPLALAPWGIANEEGIRTTQIPNFTPSITTHCKTVLRSFSRRPRKQYAGVPDWSRDPVEMEKIRHTWKAVYERDPKQHDPSDFVYLVTAHSFDWLDADAILKYMEEFPQREVLHLSAVSHELTSTFFGKEFGYIVKVPPENIVATSPVDITYQNLAHSLPNPGQNFQYGLHTPEALIGETNTTPVSPWNEVQARGTHSEKGTKIEVVGFYILPNTGPNHRATETMIRQLAKRTGLPVIVLPEPPQRSGSETHP